MAHKKFRENLFLQSRQNIAESDEITDLTEEGEIADWAKNNAFITKTPLYFRIDHKLAARLEKVAEELRETLPEQLRQEFNFSKLGELCFTELLHDYEKRADKIESVLAQIVSVWCDQNQNSVNERVESKGINL